MTFGTVFNSPCSTVVACEKKQAEKDSCFERRVVALDIDDTICCAMAHDIQISAHPECILIEDVDGKESVFRPYISLFIDYLLKNNFRIVIYSAGSESRNIDLIPRFLKNILGCDKYEKLVVQGQFKIFSSQHCDPYKTGLVKHLNRILEGNETLNDVILIDDNHDHRILVPGQKVQILNPKNTWKNNVYFWLGIFETYFESFSHLPLREGLSHFVQQQKSELSLVRRGLRLVRETNPFALFYHTDIYLKQGYSELVECSHTFEQTIPLLADILNYNVSVDAEVLVFLLFVRDRMQDSEDFTFYGAAELYFAIIEMISQRRIELKPTERVVFHRLFDVEVGTMRPT